MIIASMSNALIGAEVDYTGRGGCAGFISQVRAGLAVPRHDGEHVRVGIISSVVCRATRALNRIYGALVIFFHEAG